ncbi:hypothetical protein [Hoeflea marina]|uniref:hypothetical protein n=1 Tax=Hoeflea marina TaxID=274592 RepID=UPI0011B70B77|nr:hypothetical protein [Hoeflea marina]
MFRISAKIAVVATAIAAGIGYFTFWWVLLPAFLAGAFTLVNGPAYEIIMDANRQGRLDVFPWMLTVSILPWILVGGIFFWISAALA